MSEEEQVSEQEAIQNLYAFVAQEMKAGTTKMEIARKLEEQGVDRGEAEEMTSAVYDEIAAAVQSEQYTGSALMPGLVGGVLAALIGGGVWAAIVVLTDYEIGFIAWGIGALCGFAVVWFAKGRKGPPLQIVAVATSVFGIAVGKYLTFYYFLREAVLTEYSEEELEGFSVISTEVMQYFIESAPELLSGYDILWVVFAVITAWRIPQGSGINVDPPAQSAITPG